MPLLGNAFQEINRISLANLPTPIHYQDRLSRELGVELYVKRDDLSGSVLSGNKIRKLEYLLYDAQTKGADTVLTCGGVQSNHCRATVYAARQLGMQAEVFLRGLENQPLSGNLLLCRLANATMHTISTHAYKERDFHMQERAQELLRHGKTPYIIPEGGSNALGSLGYIRAMLEIAKQADDFDYIISATGSGGTLAGLIAGAKLTNTSAHIIGVPVCDNGEIFGARINRILEELETIIPGIHVQTASKNFLDGHVGLGYALATQEELQQISSVATQSGLVLDPVYTNKAFAGLLGLIDKQTIAAQSRVLFVHTGGIFGLEAFAANF